MFFFPRNTSYFKRLYTSRGLFHIIILLLFYLNLFFFILFLFLFTILIFILKLQIILYLPINLILHHFMRNLYILHFILNPRKILRNHLILTTTIISIHLYFALRFRFNPIAHTPIIYFRLNRFLIQLHIMGIYKFSFIFYFNIFRINFSFRFPDTSYYLFRYFLRNFHYRLCLIIFKISCICGHKTSLLR